MPAAAVLLDSGGVILHPRGGRWNPRFDFEAVLRRHHPDLALDAFADAVDAGDAYLHASAADAPRRDYHRHVLAAVGVTAATDELLDELERPLPFSEVVDVYPDARPTLDALRGRGIRMAVVSDAGPELERAYQELGLAAYMDGFAISALVGVTKPDPRMFETARAAVDVAAADCLFVDDSPPLVAAAIDLGYQAVCLRRTGDLRTGDVPTVTSLEEVVPLALA